MINTMLHFFFIISKGKFVRIDFENITHVVETKDHVHLSTTTGVYKPTISIKGIKELLPQDQFTWINETTAIPRVFPNNNR
jgi:hypothetical protein